MFDLQVASIIFLDSPVGTGFSYATTPEGYYSDDVTSSRHIHQFLRKVRTKNNFPIVCRYDYERVRMMMKI